MRTTICKIGNAQGIFIPKSFLLQVGLKDKAEMIMENNSIIIRKPKYKVRDGWAKASKAITKMNDDNLVWPIL